eukprot:TRINITY_DN7763_c0_g1_i3.p1 TRINITY_DN7763_c0_g1~~TRINITY_DN7763_c0_g1_i3.p1  ORF type:complete len:495 (-),score=74.73 TRINITY_DN7763_c0_g1_i3:390-1874(-)
MMFLAFRAIFALGASAAVPASPVVPREKVATWLSANPFSDEPFGGYCAHAPVQMLTVSSPLTSEEQLLLRGTKLVGLQVAFRHGARVMTKPSKVLQCFQVENYSMDFDCGIRRDSEYSAGHDQRHLKIEEVFPRSTGHCGTGRLQNEAVAQFEALAKALQENYDFKALGINVSSTKFRSDESPRVVAFVYLLASSLFPTGRQIRLHETIQSQAGWGGSADCPRALKEMQQAKAHADTPISGPPASFAKQWEEVAGTVFKPESFKDCLTQAACTPSSLPGGFTQQLFHWAINHSMHAYRSKFRPETCAALVAPAIFELQDMLREQNSEPKVEKMVLYGTHDNALVCILLALGAWDGKWPTYAETLVLESYRHTASDDGPAFVRLLRRGRPVSLPGCGGHTVCDVRDFQKLGPQKLRDPSAWHERCGGGLRATTMVSEVAPAAPAIGSVPWCWWLVTLALCLVTMAVTLAVSQCIQRRRASGASCNARLLIRLLHR